MTVIRLRRQGRKGHPVYRIVVANKKDRRDGRFIESIGTYTPCAPGKKADDNFTIDLERADYWIGVGSQPSDTVKTILKKARKASPEKAEAAA